MKKTAKVLAIMLAITMVLASFVGCGGKKAEASAPAATAASAPASTPAAKPEASTPAPAPEPAGPKQGGKMVIAAAVGANTFFMPTSSTTGNNFMASASIEQLGRVDANGNVTPWLAESFETDAENLTFTIKLRDGVYFHDGSVCDAEAVKWNIDQYIENGHASEIGSPKAVSVIDPLTVQIQYESWANNWENVVGAVFISSKEAYEKNGKEWCAINAVGTGPFKLVEFIADNRAVYKKNENYRIKGLPYLDELEIDVISDMNTRVSALMNKEVDVAIKFENANIIDMIKKAGFESIGRQNANVADIKHIIWNSKSTAHPMGDLKVRQAIMHCIDWDNVAKSLTGGLGIATPLFCTPDSWAYHPDAEFYTYDIELGKKLLAEAGYPNGFDTTIYCTSANSDTATAFQACLSLIGIRAKVEVTDKSKLAKMQVADDIDGFIANRGASQMDYTANYIRLYSSEGIKNHGIMLRPAEFEEPLFAARAAKTLEEKKENLQKAAKALVQDYVMLTPLAVVYYQSFSQPNVVNTGIYEASLEQWTPEAIAFSK